MNKNVRNVSFELLPLNCQFLTIDYFTSDKRNFFFRKHFIDTTAFQCHIKGKPHKRRLHALKGQYLCTHFSECTVNTILCTINAA